MQRRLLLAIVACALVAPATLAPMAAAHFPSFPAPTPGPCQMEHAHHYGTGTSLDGRALVTSVTWRNTVILLDSCVPQNGEGDYGIGGGFLPADHHSGFTCVFDDVIPNVHFHIGAVDASGNVVAISDRWDTCGWPVDSLGVAIPPGADNGWWIFLVDVVEVTTSGVVVSTPTTGHIYGF